MRLEPRRARGIPSPQLQARLLHLVGLINILPRLSGVNDKTVSQGIVQCPASPSAAIPFLAPAEGLLGRFCDRSAGSGNPNPLLLEPFPNAVEGG